MLWFSGHCVDLLMSKTPMTNNKKKQLKNLWEKTQKLINSLQLKTLCDVLDLGLGRKQSTFDTCQINQVIMSPGRYSNFFQLFS